MRQTDTPTDADPCTTSADALAAFGVEDGTRLVRQTYADLVEDGFGTYEPTDAYLDRAAATFRAVFAEETGVAVVPPDVDAAIDDARQTTPALSDEDADLRTDFLPRFYRRFAGYYCAYGGRPLSTD
jgi:hypothetical protein